MKQKKILVCCYQSWFHFFGICAYLESIDYEFDKIFVYKVDFYGNYSNEFGVTLDVYGKKIYKVSKHADLLCLIEKNIYIEAHVLWPSMPPVGIINTLSRLNIKYKLFAIEEGIGSYNTFFNIAKIEIAEKIRLGGRGCLFSTLDVLFKRLLTSLYISRKKISYIYFYKDDMSLNTKNIENYKKALHLFYSDEFVIDGGSNMSVFVSSPFVEMGLVSKDNYINIIRSLKERSQLCGVFYIKPHPSEDVSKFSDFNVLKRDVPIEIYIMSNKNNISKIYSFSSTSIYTINVLFNIVPKRIVEYDFFYQKMSYRQKKIIDSNSEKFF